MRIFPKMRSADAKEMSRQGELAFTMVEIAISIGVIGFALVAIIGILPAGMNVQKDNREDTLISQDAPFFLDAIRNGVPGTNTLFSAHGLDFLTSYVQSIRFVNRNNQGLPISTNTYSNFVAGWEIIGLLSTPQNNYNSPYFTSNYFDVTATVRALSGPATEQNGLNSIMAFTYRMDVMVTPFNSFAYSTTNWSEYAQQQGADPNQVLILSNRWVEATPGLTNGSGALVYNLFDVRLRFSWPVLQNGSVGPGRQTYRTLVSSPMARSLVLVNNVTMTNWFFQPQTFATAPPNNL